MVWGCMGWNGVGIMVEVEGRMKSDQYVRILGEGLLESIQNSGISPADVIFQQDNDPKHTSGLATQFFNKQEINVLDWPAQSHQENHKPTSRALMTLGMHLDQISPQVGPGA